MRSRRAQKTLLFAVASVFIAYFAANARADKIDDLSAQLRSSDYKIRLGAALSLGRVESPRVVGPLTVALVDENPTVRGVAAAALAKRALGPDIDIAQLEKTLKALCQAQRADSSDFVKTQAKKAFAQVLATNVARAPATPCNPGVGKVPVGVPAQRYVIVPRIRDESKSSKGDEVAFLERELAKQIAKSAEFAVGTVQTTLAKGQVGYELVVGIKRLAQKADKGGVMIECQTEGFLATFPGGSMLTAGALPMKASIRTPNIEAQILAGRRDCLGGLADALSATAVEFARSRK